LGIVSDGVATSAVRDGAMLAVADAIGVTLNVTVGVALGHELSGQAVATGMGTVAVGFVLLYIWAMAYADNAELEIMKSSIIPVNPPGLKLWTVFGL
jgi:hypothetical protein